MIQSVKINWFDSEKYFCTDESVKRQITDSVSENLTDSDLESKKSVWNKYLILFKIIFQNNLKYGPTGIPVVLTGLFLVCRYTKYMWI